MQAMVKRDIIVIGASAGGVEALKTVVSGLPADLAAAVLVILHVPTDGRSELPAILARTSRLPVAHARVDGPLTIGTITVAPPDRHLTLRGDVIHLSRGPRVHGHRPAIDPLFQTAAREGGRRVIGVILSGALNDGAAGMRDIKDSGGLTVVQDPDDALHAGMPRSVLEQIDVDRVLPATSIAAALVELVAEP
jgi:two-component system chemotaxis response regulator CheB